MSFSYGLEGKEKFKLWKSVLTEVIKITDDRFHPRNNYYLLERFFSSIYETRGRERPSSFLEFTTRNDGVNELDVSGKRLVIRDKREDNYLVHYSINPTLMLIDTKIALSLICSYFPNIQIVDLSANKLEYLPSEILSKLPSLQQLYCSDNQISEIGPQISKLTSLTCLQLNFNRIQSLPPEIGELLQLKEFKIDDNQISSFPPSIHNLIHLETFNVSLNHLHVFPFEFTQQMTNLTSLDLSHNSLQCISPLICKLEKLQSLNLGDNQISDLPNEIALLTHLRILLLRNNQIRELPLIICNLSQLTQLNLYQNQLRSIPPSISELKNLGYFNVRANPLPRDQLELLPSQLYLLNLY